MFIDMLGSYLWLFHNWWCREAVIRRRGRECPFKCCPTLPRLGGRSFTATNALQHHVEKQQLRRAEPESANTGNHIEIRKLQRVVGNTPRHTCQPKEMLHKEREVEEEHGQPEMPFAQRLIVHMPGPFWQPIIGSGEYREERA